MNKNKLVNIEGLTIILHELRKYIDEADHETKEYIDERVSSTQNNTVIKFNENEEELVLNTDLIDVIFDENDENLNIIDTSCLMTNIKK